MSVHRDGDPHESVTIAPPAPNFDEIRPSPRLPSLSDDGEQGMGSALEAGSRAGSGHLSRIVAELSAGLAGVEQANEHLLHELSTLRAMLDTAREQQLALTHRAAPLEQELVTIPAPPAPETTPRPALVSAASLPPGAASPRPILKQKPDPMTRPLVDYSLGEDGVRSETLEGARLSSKPPKK